MPGKANSHTNPGQRERVYLATSASTPSCKRKVAFLSLTHLPTSARLKRSSSYHAYSLGFWFGKLVYGLSTERVQIWTSLFVIPLSKDSSKFILSLNYLIIHLFIQQIFTREFPGDPVVRAPRFHCRGHRFQPWLGN